MSSTVLWGDSPQGRGKIPGVPPVRRTPSLPPWRSSPSIPPAPASAHNTPGPILPGKLTATDGVQDSTFGFSVSISSDTVVVGDHFARAAYIFIRNPEEPLLWTQTAKLEADDWYTEMFGWAVSIDGDTLVVGPPNASLGNQGKVYVFVREHLTQGPWIRVARLVLTNNGSFGSSASVSGDSLVVGAPSEANELNPALRTGAAYIFARNKGGPDAWGQVARVAAADGTHNDHFGWSASISGDTAIIGAPTGGSRSGSAYIFARDRSGWAQIVKRFATDPHAVNNAFGLAVSISGLTAIVGASFDSEHGPQSGAAYIYSRDEGGSTAWGLMTKVAATDAMTAGAQQFGTSVSLTNGAALVGSVRRAYLFARDKGGANKWGHVDELVNADAELTSPYNGEFGRSVSFSGATAIIGAYGARSAYICQLDDLINRKAACHRSRDNDPVVNTKVEVAVVTTTSSASWYTITASLTNTSATAIRDPFFEVTTLTGGNILLNADGGPKGVRAMLTPDVGDGILEPGESTTVTFVIGLTTGTRSASSLTCAAIRCRRNASIVTGGSCRHKKVVRRVTDSPRRDHRALPLLPSAERVSWMLTTKQNGSVSERR